MNQLVGSMRVAWEQHVYWTRRSILSVAFGQPDADFVVARLLQNPAIMGNLLIPYYGYEVASQFSALIWEHLFIAVELVKASKAGNTQAAAIIQQRWYENGAQVANFLGTINPNISKCGFRRMMFRHLALTKLEAVFVLKKDIGSSLAVYDEIFAEAIQMADTISFAVIKQFPKKLYR